jgi:hypothetical protein
LAAEKPMRTGRKAKAAEEMRLMRSA